MKTLASFKGMAVAAMMTVATIAAVAGPKAKAKVFVNSYVRPNYAVVSAVPSDDDVITKMEVTNDNGTIVYVTKRIANVKSAQYLLNIAKLEDGVYTVNFNFAKSGVVSKTFVVDNNVVVK